MTFMRLIAARWLFVLLSAALTPALAPRAQTAPSPPSATPQPSQGAPRAQQPLPRFDVFEFQVQGNTTLDKPSIERAVYPFLGEKKTISDVEAARTALESLYRDKGYGTVSVVIPEQQVAGGVVILQVREGKVERLEVVNAKYYSQGRILDTIESLQEGKVPYFPKVQEEIAAVNAGTDLKVTPLLRPGQAPGTTDVDLEVTDALPLHGSLTLDDYYTPSTAALRLTGALEYDNLFQRNQKLALLVQTSPQDTSEVKLYSLAYTVPIAHQFAVFSFVRSDSATEAGVGGVDIFGRGKIIGLHDIIPLASAFANTPDATFTQTLSLGADYKDFDQNVTVGTNASEGFSTPIRYVPFTAAYNSTATRDKGEWDFGGSVEFAIRDFGNTASEFDAKRYKALSNFAIFKFDVVRIQPVAYGLSLYGKLDLQVADQPLVSNEQLVVGGNNSVRGYLTASEAGDSGAESSIEVRSPNLLLAPEFWLTQIETHAFFDGAYVKVISPLPGQFTSFELMSTGVGLRAKRGQMLSFDLDLAWPLRSVLDTRGYSPRLQGAATVSF